MLNYEVFWLREQRGGALGGEYGGQSTALWELPINETLAGRIRALTQPGTTTSLHLPFLSYRDRKNWPTRQLELPVRADANGRITVGDAAQHQFGALLAGPVVCGHTAPMVFDDVRQFPLTDWDTAVLPMLAAHEIRMEDPGWRPGGGPFQVSWSIKLPARYTKAWVEVPHRSEAAFLSQFRGLSTAVQRALRIWMPYQYLGLAERYAKPLYAHPYMVYSTLPPHPSRRKTQLTFHVLEPQRVVRSLTRLTKPLGEQLRRARLRIAAAASLDPETAADYHAEQAREIVRAMQRLPRVFGGLLALEAFVVEEFVGFAAKAHDLQGTQPLARRLVDPGLELLHNIRVRLARSQGGESFKNLTNLVLLAATAGLFGREGPDEGILQATVSVQETGTGRQNRGNSRFSYANF